ncbi:IS110 family transposase [Streptomyces sp. BE133]|uniref:IS110 family transposase n=1 Tax=Streptomyces sp. BE133 TaxID=3002523 RepID=UPI002E75F72E|nr:IS110 family transposase [Streptomyces sp. BE133]MEE1811823.1 IS110 family transposase [Streptomyces sp. BE133]
MVRELWAGTDAGKGEHHCTVIDADGTKVLSRRVPNNEPELLELISDVLDISEDVTWAIDLNAGGAALLITLLVNHGQKLLYIPGRTIHHASAAYRGDGKTDAKDAYVIADQARMRRDLQPLAAGDDISVDLKILTARRYDLTADRIRAINRMRAQILEYFPALERAFDYSGSKAALVLLTGYQTPAALRRIGTSRLAAWLKNRKARSSAVVAATAVQAAESQHTAVPGEKLSAAMVVRLAKEVMTLDEEIAEIDALIESRLREHRHAEVILLSLPGMGPLLSAEFIAITGGDMSAFGTCDRLAGVAGLAPVPRDSGRISGNLHRPRRYNRRLLRVFYLSAQIAARCCPVSKKFYDRKRGEGKGHKQAILALARRRLNVLWALIRDNRTFELNPSRVGSAAA